MNRGQSWGSAALACALAAAAVGCGTPGAPLPPSLNLPLKVTDLSAIRAGDKVSLVWTMPKKTTDKLFIKGFVTVRVCRREAAAECVDAGAPFPVAPGVIGTYSETLPAALSSGPARTMSYFVELKNSNGRSAGLSNAVVMLAGAPPEPVRGFTAEVRKAGAVLHWTPGGENVSVRLQRRLLTPQAEKPRRGPLGPAKEPVEQDLWIEGGSQIGQAIDKDIRFGETYEYRAQRVARITADGKTLELGGELSPPVQVEAKDVFPPAVPTGLVAVATLGDDGGETAIDLSWQPDAEPDTAGYIVYRREGDEDWQRISPAQPAFGPGFHDAHVVAGHTYRYAVSAVDQGGHESARSAEAQETVPQR